MNLRGIDLAVFSGCAVVGTLDSRRFISLNFPQAELAALSV